ncbi:Phospholipase_D-nuclease N-terminal [Actinokineospora alba]|uniref:Phospholipase_D-nuclease N-terminal n=1 Tax=Actinokineospora alba TaxID=504798 RepID=A0A1H0FMJ6_9PSEU|nr:PLD nuclease N-terminal domain-containing protein [Actinokineospora alba]TDP69537.1 phospholipase D-like protein [Actinokineospora alba]SDI14687.1 Phospholipase_D-nuclease N-terminal [Actinokineospora alba]SDN95814.1 Phospholipase_D-nuclease N-terminal [Actinokineospora alba]
MTRKKWSDLKPGQRRGFVAASLVEFALAAAAWTDLARRTPEQVRGRKPLWAAAIAVNFVGPIAYFCWGRVPADRGHGSGGADVV